MKYKQTESETVHLGYEPSIEQLVDAIFNSLEPIKSHLLEKLESGEGQILDIRITVDDPKVSMGYGVAPIEPPEQLEITRP